MLGVGIGLGVGEFIGRRPGIAPKLDLNFASTKSLTASKGPTPSFSRASTGSYFDGSGVLRYANVNTILYSEEFDNAYWTKVRCSVTANNSTSPTGANSADLITQTPGQTVAGGITRTISWVSGTIYTFSIYAKKIDKNRIMIIERSTGDGRGTFFNISNGTVGTTDPNHTASIQDAGNGWYRCSITFSGSTISDALTNYHVDNESTTVIGSGSTLFWGAQLEASSTVGTYCPTTSSANSAPRFDHTYNGTSWVSKGLLVEDQRTNICLFSEQFNDLSYTKNNCTVSGNTIASPDGQTTADTLTATSSTGIHYLEKTGYTVSTVQYTISLFAKYGTHRYLQLSANNEGAGVYANFDLISGVVGSVGASTSSQITNVGGGWYRCSMTYTATNTASRPLVVMVSSSTAARVESNTLTSGDYLYLWGCQQETGAFPTSYIGTTNSGVVRSADVCQITGSDFSGFWNGTEGGIACEFDRIGNKSAADQETFNFSNAGGTEQIYHNAYSGSDYVLYYAGSATQANLSAGSTSSVGTITKIATAYKVNDFALSTNGGAAVTDTSGTVPAPDRLWIGSGISNLWLNGHIARLRYFNKRLPNATLQKLST